MECGLQNGDAIVFEHVEERSLSGIVETEKQ